MPPPVRLKSLALLLFLSLSCIYTAISARAILTHTRAPDGDEGEFIAMVRTLARTGTVHISSERSGDVSNLVLLHDHTQMNNRAPVLPILVLPFYLAMGETGAILSMAPLAALMIACLFWLCVEVTEQVTASLVSALIVGLSFPVLPFATTIHPGILTALFLVAGMRTLIRFEEAPGDLVSVYKAAFLISVLPWCHFGNIPLAAYLCGHLLVAVRGWRRRIGILTLLAASVSGAFLMAYVFMFYSFGGPTYAALKATDVMTGPFSVAHLPRSVPGLLLDRAKGLLTFAPIYFDALGALTIAFRGRAFALIFGSFGVQYVFAALYYCWFGGFSPPARMILTVIPLLAVPLTYKLSLLGRSAPAVIVSVILLVPTAFVSYLYMRHPAPFAVGPDGHPLAVAIGRGWLQNIVARLPSYMGERVVALTPFRNAASGATTGCVMFLGLMALASWNRRASVPVARVGGDQGHGKAGSLSARGVAPAVYLSLVPVAASLVAAAGKGDLLLRYPRNNVTLEARVEDRLKQWIEGDAGERGHVDLEMVEVPAGSFVMGSDAFAGAAFPGDDGYPAHVVYLDAYFLGRYEVTNGQYYQFVASTGFPPPANWHAGMPVRGSEKHPVTGISWYEAAAFSRWVGGRLPTEAEWEKAARGNPSWAGKRAGEVSLGKERGLLLFPWGPVASPDRMNWDSAVSADRLNCLTSQVGGTRPVGSYPAGVSRYGLMDMAGNAWEYCSDWYEGTYYTRSPVKNPMGPARGRLKVLRGGAWFAQCFYSNSSRRFAAPPNQRGEFGLRVARSLG